MKRLLLLLSLSLVSLGLVGCGGTNSGATGFDGGFVATGGTSNVGSGNLVFNFVQAQETTTTVPVGTVRLKFDFYNGSNTIILSETLDYANQIIFENVSSTVTRVVVTALNGDGFPIAEGTADLTIPAGSEQEVNLAVAPVTLDALVISPDSVGLIVGATQQLAVQGFWSNGFIANIDAATAAYSGNDAGVATVTTGGLVTAVAVGSTSVTVSYTVAGTSSEVSSNPVPINVVGAAIALTGTTNTFNTDNGELNGTVHPGWDGTTLLVESFDLPEGAILNVTGTAAFQLTTSGNITVNGLLGAAGQTGFAPSGNASGAGGAAGPGGFAGGRGGGFDIPDTDGADGQGPGAGGGAMGATTEESDVAAGGGGAGHSVAGSAGSINNPGSGQAEGAGGVAYDSIPDSLIGGSGGGGGSDENDGGGSSNDGGGGGGGGGAIRMIAQGLLSVGLNGYIDCSGGDGGDGGAAGAGGAGSGGSIELRGSALPTVDGTLDVSGGAGGQGVGNGANGGAGASGRTVVGI